jgi:hypothetical protein
MDEKSKLCFILKTKNKKRSRLFDKKQWSCKTLKKKNEVEKS